MAEDSNDSKTYELAYHLNPDLEEAKVRTHVQELNELVTKSGGSVLTAREPRRIHLSYPVKNKGYAYFGVTDFAAPAETIEKINAQMKLQNGLLRYLLLVKPDIKDLRILGEHRARPRLVKTHEPGITETKKAPAKDKPKE